MKLNSRLEQLENRDMRHSGNTGYASMLWDQLKSIGERQTGEPDWDRVSPIEVAGCALVRGVSASPALKAKVSDLSTKPGPLNKLMTFLRERMT